MKLRLYHHPDGARIAYREAGTGPPLALLHSQGLTHREFEPVVDELAHRHRVVLPDLPLHGDVRGPPDPPVHAGVADRGARRLPARHLRAAAAGRPATASARSSRCARSPRGALAAVASSCCCPTPMHTKPARSGLERAGRGRSCAPRSSPAATACLARAGALVLRPSRGDRLTATGAPGVRDLVRHALMDLGGNGNRVRSWAKAARRWPRGAQKDLLDAYPGMDFPVLLLWADDDPAHPLAIAEEALRPAARRAAARAPAHRLPDRLRRPGRRRPRARRLLRVSDHRYRLTSDVRA